MQGKFEMKDNLIANGSGLTSGFNSDQVTHARTEQFACVVDASNP